MTIAIVSKRNIEKVLEYAKSNMFTDTQQLNTFIVEERRDLKCRDTVYVIIQASQLSITYLRKHFGSRVIKHPFILQEQGRI